MSEHLYELTAEMRRALDGLELYCSNDADPLPGEEDELLKLWAGIEAHFNEKVEKVGLMVLKKRADADLISAEIARLKKRQDSINRTEAWLTSYLQQNLVAAGQKKVEGKLCTVSRRATPPSVRLTNAAEGLDPVEYLAPEYIRFVPEKHEVDKKAILAWYKQTGEIVASDFIDIQQGETLSVK